MAKLAKVGYGQLELNQVAFPRDGRIEAQCALSTTDFSETAPAENGMILAIDNVTRTITLPTGGANEVLGLNYSSEHIYDERLVGGLKHFKLVPGEFYPRLGLLSVGDKFTTNTVSLTTAYDELTDTKLKTGVYMVPGTDGYWTETADVSKATASVIARVIKKTTMPDGQKAVKLQIVKA